MSTIVGDMLALDTVPATFAAFLSDRSSGNPFFAAEYLRAAMAEGLLGRSQDGRWQVSARAEALEHLQQSLPFPASLRLHGVARYYFRQSCEEEAWAEDPNGIGIALYYEANYEATFCRWDRAERLADEAIARLTATGDRHELQIARTVRANIDQVMGRFEAALPRFAEVRASARAMSNAQLEGWGAYATARSLVPLGRTQEALPLLREAVRLLEGQADRASEIICHGLLAEALLALGDVEQARRAADRVLELGRGGRPAALTEGRGYESAADVYLALAERGTPGGHARASAQQACALLAGFARMFPLAGPADLRSAKASNAGCTSTRPRRSSGGWDARDAGSALVFLTIGCTRSA